MGKPHSLVGEAIIQEMCEYARDTPPGCIVEVGVYQGGTAWHLNELCKVQNRVLYLFDTFTGIPYRNVEMGDPCLPGDFSDCSEEQVRRDIPEAVIVRGLFPYSAFNLNIKNIAFVHLDCDQYQSYLDSAWYLGPLMISGGVMWFDDYCLPGAKKALDDTFGDRIQTAKCGKQFVKF